MSNEINCKCPLCAENCSCIGDGFDFYVCKNKKIRKIKTELELFRKPLTEEKRAKLYNYLVNRKQDEWKNVITREFLDSL